MVKTQWKISTDKVSQDILMRDIFIEDILPKKKKKSYIFMKYTRCLWKSHAPLFLLLFLGKNTKKPPKLPSILRMAPQTTKAWIPAPQITWHLYFGPIR
jgi:hypothetical protein